MMEETKMMRALKLGDEYSFSQGRDMEMKLKPVLGDMKGNKLRELWHHHPLHLLYKTKNPQKSLKRWLKKVFALMLEIERQIGSNLTRPPEFMPNPIAIKWRFELLYSLNEQRLNQLGIILPENELFKWGNDLKIRF